MLFICDDRSTFYSSFPQNKKAFIATFPSIFYFLWDSYAEGKKKERKLFLEYLEIFD